MKLSVAMVSYNEEVNIARVLAPLAGLADEIVVVDSFSADGTCALAEAMGAQVYQEPWAGYIGQKNSALAKCRGEWILALDCDEVLTPELAASIRNAISGEGYAGYTLNRRTFYMGRLLKYSWQPDRKLRLVRREAHPLWGGYDPHDVLSVQGAIGRLEGDLIHYSFKDFADHMRKTAAHAANAAKSYHARGKRSGAAALFGKPIFAFFKKFVLQRSALDGVPGLVAALSGAVYTYMKYAFLLELQNIPAKPDETPPRAAP